MNLRLQKAMLFFGLFGGAADDRVEPRHDFERLRRAAGFGHAFLEVAVEILRAGEAPMAPLGRPQVEWSAALGGIRWLMQKLWLCARNWRAARARMITANGAARSLRAACNTAWARMSRWSL